MDVFCRTVHEKYPPVEISFAVVIPLTVTGLAALLILGLAVTTWQAVRATRAEMIARVMAADAEQARHAELDQRMRAEAQRDQANAERMRAEVSEEQARKAEANTKAVVDFLSNDMLAATRPNGVAGGQGRDVSVRQVMNAAQSKIAESFKDQNHLDAIVAEAQSIVAAALAPM